MKNSLENWINTIQHEVMFVNVKPYSHNIIGVCLMGIANEYGREAANKVIEDLDLERLGWRKEAI